MIEVGDQQAQSASDLLEGIQFGSLEGRCQSVHFLAVRRRFWRGLAGIEEDQKAAGRFSCFARKCQDGIAWVGVMRPDNVEIAVLIQVEKGRAENDSLDR